MGRQLPCLFLSRLHLPSPLLLPPLWSHLSLAQAILRGTFSPPPSAVCVLPPLAVILLADTSLVCPHLVEELGHVVHAAVNRHEAVGFRVVLSQLSQRNDFGHDAGKRREMEARAGVTGLEVGKREEEKEEEQSSGTCVFCVGGTCLKRRLPSLRLCCVHRISACRQLHTKRCTASSSITPAEKRRTPCGVSIQEKAQTEETGGEKLEQRERKSPHFRFMELAPTLFVHFYLYMMVISNSLVYVTFVQWRAHAYCADLTIPTCFTKESA